MPIADFEQKHASFDLGVYKIILMAGGLMERSKGKGQGMDKRYCNNSGKCWGWRAAGVIWPVVGGGVALEESQGIGL